jgi:hypothetical protein
MGVESAKLAVFILFFVAFVIIARRLFSNGTAPYPADYQPPYSPPPDDFPDPKRPAVIGAELPFPVGLPPVQQRPDGRYNRPKVLNYYFSNLDLKSGPPNPRSFCDQLFVEFEAPETGARWTSEYTIATPFGLQDLLDETGQRLSFDGTVIVVPRWDMADILRTVLDDVMERYVHAEPNDAEAEDSSRRYQG